MSYSGEQSLSRSRLDVLQQRWDRQWEINFNLLKQFQLDNGHCTVLRSYIFCGVNLGTWLMTQCKLKKKKALNDNKQVRLENLGVVWDNDHRWEINLHCVVNQVPRFTPPNI